MKSNYLKVLSKLNDLPTGNEIPLKYERNKVHTNGWWHCGVVANIIRLDEKGKLQILVQQRSGSVDIAGHKFDQSLANQMLFTDKTKEDTLLRGLKEELNLLASDIKYKEFFPNSRFFIVKEYLEKKEMLNREKISLFVIKLKNDKKISSNCIRVSGLKWINWYKFVQEIITKPDLYTKTVRFCVVNKLLRNKIEAFMYDFIKNKKTNFNNNEILDFLFVSPRNNKDEIIRLR